MIDQLYVPARAIPATVARWKSSKTPRTDIIREQAELATSEQAPDRAFAARHARFKEGKLLLVNLAKDSSPGVIAAVVDNPSAPRKLLLQIAAEYLKKERQADWPIAHALFAHYQRLQGEVQFK